MTNEPSQEKKPGRVKRPRANRVPKRKERPGVDRYGRVPLWYAAADGDVALVSSELAAGADPSAADDDGYTPLHVAAQNGKVTMVRHLLAHGAEPNHLDDHGNGPLWTACHQASLNRAGADQFAIVSALIAAGANPDSKNRYGLTPRDILERSGRIDLFNLSNIASQRP